MKSPVYLVEKSSGLKDANGVELYHTVAARLTRGAAETDFKQELDTGNVRVRKIVATK
jgi:hypothetical protein